MILVSGERATIGLLFIFLFLYFIFSEFKIIEKFKIFLYIFFITILSLSYLPGLKERIFDNTKTLICTYVADASGAFNPPFTGNWLCNKSYF